MAASEAICYRYKRLVVVFCVGRRGIASLRRGEPRISEETTDTIAQDSLDKANADYYRANEYLYEIIYLLTEKPASLLVVKHEHPNDTSGDGQQAFQEPVNKNYNNRQNSISTGA